MFRIHNLEELERLRKLVNRLDDDLKFPVDIFRSAKEISAMEYGEDHKEVYTYTNEDGLTVFEGSTCSENARSGHEFAERGYDSHYLKQGAVG